MEEFKDEYRCIAADLRNANGGQSTGPLEVDRPWDAYTDDHLGLMDHLGIDKFMVLGFCIGGPFIWNLLKRAPDRVVAAVLAQPSGSRPKLRDLFYDNNMKGWGPELIKRRPEITMETVEQFLTRMYRTNPDFVFTVTRDFVRNCQTPVLILPDDIPPHPYAVAMEIAMLAPKAEVSMFPWKEPKERIPAGGAPDALVPAGASVGPARGVNASMRRVEDARKRADGAPARVLLWFGRPLRSKLRTRANFRTATPAGFAWTACRQACEIVEPGCRQPRLTPLAESVSRPPSIRIELPLM